jgi:hypothetical protein
MIPASQRPKRPDVFNRSHQEHCSLPTSSAPTVRRQRQRRYAHRRDVLQCTIAIRNIGQLASQNAVLSDTLDVNNELCQCQWTQ